jgi:VWFA-related protein
MLASCYTSGGMRHVMGVTLLLSMCLCGRAQTSFQTDVKLVRVPTIVTDHHNAPVNGLRREDFIVLEDGKVQEVKYLWQELDLPLRIVFVASPNCSLSQFFERYDRGDVSRFVSSILWKNARASVVVAGPQQRKACDWTGSEEHTLKMLKPDGTGHEDAPILGEPCSGRRGSPYRTPDAPCGFSPLWNAVYFSATHRLREERGRKAMLLLTDGWDTGSDHNLEEAIAASQDAEAMVYSVWYDVWQNPYLKGIFASGIPLLRMENRGKPDLGRIGRMTGGLAFNGKSDSLPEAFARIESDLRSQYVLGYTPRRESTGRSYRKIEVRVKQSGLTVRAREGYFSW